MKKSDQFSLTELNMFTNSQQGNDQNGYLLLTRIKTNLKFKTRVKKTILNINMIKYFNI